MSTLKISNNLKNIININSHPPIIRSNSFNKKLNNLLFDFNQTASSNKLTSDTWTIFSTAALVSLNRPSVFEPFWLSLIKNNEKLENNLDLIYQAKLIRETGLKSISFIGIAKSINALNEFKKVLEEKNPEIIKILKEIEKPKRIPNLNENSIENIKERANLIWKSIYRPLDEKLILKLSSSHIDLPIHILYSHYGALLSDPAGNPGPIGRIGTSLIAIGTLRAAGYLGPQLLSHVYGLKKSGEELNRTGEVSLGEGTQWLTSDEGAEWIIDGVDRLVNLISEFENHEIIKSKL